MAKKAENVCGCCSCKGCCVIVLIAGILFLLQDLNIWNFWGLNWYTVVFLIMGLGCLCKAVKK